MGNLTPPRPRYRTPQEPGTIDREEAVAVQKLDSDAQKHMVLFGVYGRLEM